MTDEMGLQTFPKKNTYDADVTFFDRVFHIREAATGKVRSTMVEKKRVRQTISDDDDDDGIHYFRNVYTHMKMNILVGFYSNTLEYCQGNPHETDRNDVSPRDFFKLTNPYLCATFNIRNHVRAHSFVRRVHCKKTCLYLFLAYKTCSYTTFHIGGRVCVHFVTYFPYYLSQATCFHANVSILRYVHAHVCALKDVFLHTFLTYEELSICNI